MRHLILLRHAKSCWLNEQLDDHDRPLNPRGEHDAPLIASRMAHKLDVTPKVISSSATRAQCTAQALLHHWPQPLEIAERLYHCEPEVFLEIARQQDNETEALVLVAHNPSIVLFIATQLGLPLDNLPTAGWIWLSADIDNWQQLQRQDLKIRWLDFPKNHPDYAKE